MDPDPADSELPRQCTAWRGFVFGDRLFDAAQESPDTWSPVFELTCLEFVMVALGVRLKSFRYPPQAIQYDSASRRYLAYPLQQMPASAGLQTTPSAVAIWMQLVGPRLCKILRFVRAGSQ